MALNLQAGTVFAGHRIDELIGRGGMGVVYRATQLALERTVALKLVAPELAVDEGFRERFKRESRLAASIDHPHVITIFEAGESDGQLYVTMRFVDGTDLDELLAREGALPPGRAATIVAQVASALDAAHARGLVHRDIKPANVLLGPTGAGDHAFLTDFGLTKRVEGTERLTRTGQWIGTPAYAAPEQVVGQGVDALKATSFEVKSIDVGESPSALTFGEGAAWVALDESETIRRLDPDTGEPGGAIGIGGGVGARGLAVGEGAVWVRSGTGTVTKVDADSGQIQGKPIEVGGISDGDLEIGEGVVWTVDSSGSLSRIDPSSGTVKGTATLAGGTNGSLAVGEGAVWVVNRDRPTITKVDPDSGRPQGAPITVGTAEYFFEGTVAAGEGSVWVVDPDDDLLVRIDPESGRRTGKPTQLPEGFDGDVSVGGGAVWVASSSSPGVVRVDPSTGKVVGAPVGAGTEDAGVVAIGEGSAWVTNPSAWTVTRVGY